MNVVMVNWSDQSGGAARASFRLFQALRNIGINVRLLVQRKQSTDRDVLGGEGLRQKAYAVLTQRMDALPLRFYRRRKTELFSTGVFPNHTRKRIQALAPDIVHLHWVAFGMLPIAALSKLERPAVWTLHDMWGLTGGCHYDEGCDRFLRGCGLCPILRSEHENDLSARLLQKKRIAIERSGITIVSPSRWLAAQARQSVVFAGSRIEVIPNGLDLTVYKPLDQSMARSLFSLPMHKHIVLFGAASPTGERRKGYQLLVEALDQIARTYPIDEICVVLFGQSDGIPSSLSGFPVHVIGTLHDDVSLAALYSSADVFVVPSLQDNLPNTVAEALACGTPCVAFNIGGMSDLIQHRVNGYLAAPFDTTDLARGIVELTIDRKEAGPMRQAARKTAETMLDQEMMAKHYVALYQDLGRARSTTTVR